MRIEEILAGANGDSQVGYVELKFRANGAPAWGPQGSETRSRAILSFHDATGEEVDSFEFPIDPPVGPIDPDNAGHSVLVATQEFVDLTGVAADYVISARPEPLGGMVCFGPNPLNPVSAPTQCLAYGNYQGGLESDGCDPATSNGPPAPALAIAGAAPIALVRVANLVRVGAFGCGHRNIDFDLAAPAPRNSAGQTAALAAASPIDQGRELFLRETFAGNGRTCGTCHRPEDDFGIVPATVADVFASDPFDVLFIAEHEPPLAELENSCLLRSGNQRALFLENIDGFHRSPSFRGSPHLLNIKDTAPYGQSEGFSDLQSFCTGAVKQHMPRSLARNGDPSIGPLDFRLPTSFELEALEAFMESIHFPADGDLSVDRMIELAIRKGLDAAAIARGRDLVDGTTGSAQCHICHGGPTFSDANGDLGMGNGNAAFDIGLAFVAANTDDGCEGGIGDPSLPLPAEFRRFSTAPLLGVARTGPFFHDNSAETLHEAVAHYASEDFSFSEASVMLEGIQMRLDLEEDEIDDIVVFLEAISIDPSGVPLLCGDASVDAPDEACDDGNLHSGDGCSGLCQIEDGFECSGGPSSCEEICDDGGIRSCDLNEDGFVDRRDVDAILAARNTPAIDACDPMDPDRDGQITVHDGRVCAQECDNAGCRPTPVCGLLGIEVLGLLAVARRSRGRRSTGRRSRPSQGTRSLRSAPRKRIWLAGLLIMPALVAASDVEAIGLSFLPGGPLVVHTGDLVEVKVLVWGLSNSVAPSVGDFDLSISYAPEILAYQGVTFGNFLGTPGSDAATDAVVSPGALDLASISLLFPGELDALQPSSFTLASVVFSAIGAGISFLDFQSASVGDANGSPLLLGPLGSGQINVIPEPTTGLLMALGVAGLVAGMKGRRSRDRDWTGARSAA